ncbi:LysR family transcriptional regulator [Catenovulum sp. 2E275]|uniref:LysR family transcriptional regulator n=1 Tax=Catenovulum sp. 2E275 TaxID=2980497 RepID=UPI0021D1EEAB|nr:LysR family transcriptional regulator [Catenovulum sp. 2E275]MCU4674035.1 LysR family transcriptional regulator [Catenovulum sp. 2E275]
MNIENKDFNLLYLFSVLYEERSLTKASKRLNLSQPALSHKLNKLRDEFSDQLFVRTGRGLSPTPKADQMALEVCGLVKSIEQFYQQTKDQDFFNKPDNIHIFTTDFIELLILPELIKRVRKMAPKVKIITRNTGGGLPLDAFEQGKCDIAIAGFYQDLPNHYYRQNLAEYQFHVLYYKNNPHCQTQLDLETYINSQHVVTSLTGDLNGVVDKTLAKMGRSREVIAGASSFLVLPHVIRNSTLMLTCLTPIARHATSLYNDLACQPPPLNLPTVQMEQVWHPRTQTDPLRKWIRSQIKEIFETIKIT